MAAKPKKQKTTVIAAGYVREEEQPGAPIQPSLFDSTIEIEPIQPTIPPKQIPKKTLEERMSDFIAQSLNLSRIYFIPEQDKRHILLQIPQEGERPTLVYLALHPDDQMKEEEFIELEKQNKASGIYTAHIFVKDRIGNDERPVFFRRLAEIAHYKRHQSLKRYTKEQRDTIIKLRRLEKLALKYSRRAAYYQNPTSQLQESIRIYNMLPVTQDYFHQLVDEEKVRSFAGLGRKSQDWRLAEEVLPKILPNNPAYIVLAPNTCHAFITARQPQ